jgi:multiple sugar transport system substrate-binding protein
VAPPWVVDWIEMNGEEAFRKGEIAVLRAWPNAWRTMQDAENGTVVAGKVGIGLPLHAEGGRGHSVLGGWQFAIANASPAPREAWALVSFLSSPEQQRARAIKKGYIPTRPALLADPAVRAANPQFALLDRFRDAIRPRPILSVYREVSRILSLHVHRALLGEESPRDALRAAAARIGPLLDRGRGAESRAGEAAR